MWNSKPKKSTCDCRRKKKGNPKIGTGPCYACGGPRQAVILRREKRQIILAGLEDIDDE